MYRRIRDNPEWVNTADKLVGDVNGYGTPTQLLLDEVTALLHRVELLEAQIETLTTGE